MTESQTVLQHAGDDDLEAALREARAALPTPAHTERLWTQIAAHASAAPTGAATPTDAGLATKALLSKMLGVVSAALIAGAAAVYLVAAPSVAPVLNATRAVSSVRDVRVPAAATHASAPPRLPAPTPLAQPVPRLASTAPTPTVHARRAQEAAHASAAQHAPIDPDAELALLTRAQNALDQRPAAALAVLQQHAARFPDGLLAQEREILRIDAELALGRTTQARTRARAFISRFPGSPHRHRFEGLLKKDHVSESDHNLKREHIPTH